MRDNLTLSHLHLDEGRDRPLRLGAVIVITVVCYALIGFVVGWLARAWMGPMA